MSDFKTIILETDPNGIAYLTLNRAEKHNAMNALMIEELSAAAKNCTVDEGIRAVILGANGKSFCAGGDLTWMREQADKNRQGKMDEARSLSNMLLAFNNLPKPLIANVQGQAYGGGIGLMAVCDIVICHPAAKFALTETKIGLIPATIGPFVVARMGEGYARQVFFTGKGFDAEFALRSGLVSQVTDNAQGAIDVEIKAILQTATGALRDAKALCLSLGGAISKDQIEMSINALADRWESTEAQHGITAFFNKEKPSWAKKI